MQSSPKDTLLKLERSILGTGTIRDFELKSYFGKPTLFSGLSASTKRSRKLRKQHRQNKRKARR